MIDNIEQVLNDVRQSTEMAIEIMRSVQDDYDSAYDRNDELSVLTSAIVSGNINIQEVEGRICLTKETVVAAYLLGRRDATEIPSAFEGL